MIARIGAIALVVLLAYVLIMPLVATGISILHPHKFADLDHATAYYQITYSVTGAVCAVVGLTLGYFYYRMRNKFDLDQTRRKLRRLRAQQLTDELNRYDSFVARILTLHLSGDSELRYIRHQIDSSSDDIYAALDCLKVNQVQVNAFVHLHSFVDNSFLIMDLPYTKLVDQPVGRDADRVVYVSRLHAVRRAFYGLSTDE